MGPEPWNAKNHKCYEVPSATGSFVDSGPDLGSLWTGTYLPQPGWSNLRGVPGVWFFSGGESILCIPHIRGLARLLPRRPKDLAWAQEGQPPHACFQQPLLNPPRAEIELLLDQPTRWAKPRVGGLSGSRNCSVVFGPFIRWPSLELEAVSWWGCLLRQPVLRTRREAGTPWVSNGSMWHTSSGGPLSTQSVVSPGRPTS